MFWVIQENLYNEYGYNTLMESIERANISHKVVKVVPFADHFLPAGFDSHSFKGDIHEIPEPEIDDSGLVMCMGSLTLAKIAKSRGWKPGSFHNENFIWDTCVEAWGDNLLNYGAYFTRISHIRKEYVLSNPFFIRPSEDTKTFSGMITTWDSWTDFIDKAGLDKSIFVVYGPLKEIYSEYRFFVVDGKIVTQSQYKFGGSVAYNALVEPLVIKFAQDRVDEWQPSRAFVIDIASTPNGYKIVEINNFNSAGFYACDVSKIIAAIENMEF